MYGDDNDDENSGSVEKIYIHKNCDGSRCNNFLGLGTK